MIPTRNSSNHQPPEPFQPSLSSGERTAEVCAECHKSLAWAYGSDGPPCRGRHPLLSPDASEVTPLVAVVAEKKQREVEASLPYRMVDSWLHPRGLQLPPLGWPLPVEVQHALVDLAETAEGKEFQSAFNVSPVLVEEVSA